MRVISREFIHIFIMTFAIRMQRQFRHLVGFLRPSENPIGIFEAFLTCAGFGRIGIADIFLPDDPSAGSVIISRNVKDDETITVGQDADKRSPITRKST